MVTVAQYALEVLQDVRDSKEILESLLDKPGDLDIIRREWYRSDALCKALVGRIHDSKTPNPTLQSTARLCKKLADYDFTQEIELLYGLYSNDPNRLKNIRIKVLEAFEKSHLSKEMNAMIEDLENI